MKNELRKALGRASSVLRAFAQRSGKRDAGYASVAGQAWAIIYRHPEWPDSFRPIVHHAACAQNRRYAAASLLKAETARMVVLCLKSADNAVQTEAAPYCCV